MMDQMISIPIREFIVGTKLPMDVFIRLGDARFVLLVKAGEILQIERAYNYEQKHVEQLYVRREDYQKYMKQNLAIAGIVLTADEIQNKKKLEILGTALNS